MKFIFASFATFLLLNFANAEEPIRACSTNIDIEDFRAQFRTSYTINEEFGNIYCQLTNSTEPQPVCAARYAFASNGIIDLLSSYQTGEKNKCAKIVSFCFETCMTRIFENILCAQNCRLPNLILK